MIHTGCISMKFVFHICLGVALLQEPSTARLYRRDAYTAKRYGDGMSSTGSWDSYQGIESYGWNNRVSPVDEACNICNSFSSQGQGYGSPQYPGAGGGGGSHHYRENHEKNPGGGDQNYRGNGYDNLSPEWNQRYRPRDRHKPGYEEEGWTKLTSPVSGGGWSRPYPAIGMMDRKDTYRPGMYPVKVSSNDKGYWDSHPPREIPWDGDRNQSGGNQGYGGGPYQPGAGGYTADFKPWDQTTKGVSGWDGNGKGIYVASSTPGGGSYASGWSGDSQKTSTRRPNYSVTIQENSNRDQSGYGRPGGSNSYIPPAYPSKPASGHIPAGPDQWDRPTSARPPPVSGYGSSTPATDSSSWDRPTTPRPSSSYDRPSSSWKPPGSGSWDKPSGPNSWDRPSPSYDRPSSSWKPSNSYDKPSSSWDRPSVTNSYDKTSSSWNKPVDSWDRPVTPNRESSGYGSSGPSVDNAPLGPDNSYIPPGPAYTGVTTLSPASYHEEHHRFPSSNANTRPGYETPVSTGTGYDSKRPCSRGGCSSGYDRPMMSFGGYGRPSGNRYGSSESNYGQSGYGNYDGYGSSNGYGGSSGGHSGTRGGGYNGENRESWSNGGYNSNRGGSSSPNSGSGWSNGGYRGGGGGANYDVNNSGNSGGYNSNTGGSSGWMNLNSNRGGSSYGSSSGNRGSSYGYGGSSGHRGGGYGDNSSGYGGSGHRYNADGNGSSNDNYGSSGHRNKGSMYGGNRYNQGGGYGTSSYDSDGSSGYSSGGSDSDRYHGRPSYGSSRPGGYDRDRPSSMSGGYDYSRPSHGSSSSMRPYEFDRVGHETEYSSSTYRPEDNPSSTTSHIDGYGSSTRGPNYDGYGSSSPDAPFQPYDQSSSTRPFLDYDRDGSPYPSDRYDYSDGPPSQHRHTGLYKVPMYNGHSGVGASTEYGFPTNIASNAGNDRDTTTSTTTTPQTNSTTTDSPATGN